ncbi:MAG: hypothetical protein ACUVWB_05540 [Anaerolineae bacterium]
MADGEAVITRLDVEPAPDRRRVHFLVEADGLEPPFPYMELSVLNPDGEEVGSMLVMGVMEPETRLTVHIRPPAPAGDSRPYLARGRLFYGADGQEERTICTVETPFTF